MDKRLITENQRIMLKIGLTGNMGSGKSTVAKVFETFGTPVFYSDPQARALYKKESVKKTMFERFGDAIGNNQGEINMKALAGIIFRDNESLSFVNALIHPMVRNSFTQWCSLHHNKPYVIQESALVYETGLHKNFDAVILVHAPEALLIERVVKRDGISRDDACIRLSNQIPQEEKMEKADYLIANDNRQLIIPQLWSIHHTFNKRASNDSQSD